MYPALANLFNDLVLQDICARLLLLPGILRDRDSVSAFSKLEVCWHSRFLERKRQGWWRSGLASFRFLSWRKFHYVVIVDCLRANTWSYFERTQHPPCRHCWVVQEWHQSTGRGGARTRSLHVSHWRQRQGSRRSDGHRASGVKRNTLIIAHNRVGIDRHWWCHDRRTVKKVHFGYRTRTFSSWWPFYARKGPLSAGMTFRKDRYSY